jgi:hypothetical protein
MRQAGRQQYAGRPVRVRSLDQKRIIVLPDADDPVMHSRDAEVPDLCTTTI